MKIFSLREIKRSTADGYRKPIFKAAQKRHSSKWAQASVVVSSPVVYIVAFFPNLLAMRNYMYLLCR